MNFHRFAFAALAIAATGCKCGPGTTNSKPDYVAMPSALQFSACPTKDENNVAVADVFPDEKKVNVENRGKAPGGFVATFSGTDAARFKLDPKRTPTDISAGGEAELPVQFSPEKTGDARATLTIDDDDVDTAPITIDLVGTGKNLPAQPTLEVSVENYATPGMFDKCAAGVLCRQGFPDTLLKDSTTLKIKLKNLGCPALKITEMTLEWANAGGPQMAFFLDDPTTLPSMMNPLVLSTADGTEEKVLIVRFSPEAVPLMDTQRFGVLTIKSNDINAPIYTISLEGQGVIPALGPIPSFCNFNDPNDICRRTGMKVANEAAFTLVNDGSSPLKIDSAVFKSTGMNNTGSGGRFTVMTPIDGTMLMPGMSTVLTVKHDDQPLFVIDQITVSASVPGMAAGTLGKVFLTVAGGTEPCLATEPDDRLSFKDATTDVSTKTITVKALAMKPGTMTPCGDLIVDGVEIPANPRFSLVAPMLMPGLRIPKGQQADITVQFSKPITGGRQAGEIIIKTNDLAYGAPSYKKLLLESDNPLNEIPQCVLNVCDARMTDCSMGATNSLMVRLSQLPTPKNITLFGGNSYDPPATTGGIAQYKFYFTAPNPNGAFMLTGGQAYSTQNYQTLTLDPSLTGQYRAFLKVKDSSGQESGMACQVNINVYQ